MKHVKILFFLVFCAFVALVVVQNADVLAPVRPLLVNWPGVLSAEFGLPMYALIAILFGAGFVLTALPYLGEHRRLKRAVVEARRHVADLERELRPEPEPEPDPGPDPGPETGPGPEVEQAPDSQTEDGAAKHESQTSIRGAIAASISSPEISTPTLQTPMESTMEKNTASNAEDKVLAENAEQASTDTASASSPDERGCSSDSAEKPAEPGPEDTGPLKTVLESISESLEKQAVPESAEASPDPASEATGTSKTVLESISESLEKQAADAGPAPVSGPSGPDRTAADGSGFREDEVLARPAGPGWGAVLLLSAALALVVSSGVFIVLNSQITAMSAQLSDLHIQSGHTASTQEEMGRIWELERVAVREELESLEQGQKDLGAGVETLEEQMAALQALPELFRKRLVAGFLRDAAGKTALWGAHLETDEQRNTLEQIEEMLQSLAGEMDAAESGR